MVTDNGSTRFDYTSVPSPVAHFLRGHAERIRRGWATSIIQIGKELVEAKRHLSHGVFIRWVKTEVGLPPRTAQAYMQVAHWAKGKSATVARLPPSVLYLVSSPSAPEEFVAHMLNKLEAGEQIDILVARRLCKSMQRKKNLQQVKPTMLPSSVLLTRSGDHQTPQDERGSLCITSDVDKSVIKDCKSPGESAASKMKPEWGLAEAVAIMAHSMTPIDFQRVRNILMNSRVLNDPQLAKNIETAFLAFERASKSGVEKQELAA
jgi:hypothetical protein